MKRQIAFIVMILITIMITACSDTNTYTSKAKDYSIKYPREWSNSGKNMGTEAEIYAPKQNEDDKYIESVHLFTEVKKSERTLEQYLESSVRVQSQKMAEDMNAIYEDEVIEQITLDGINAYRYEYTTSIADVKIRVIRYIVKDDNKFHVISFNIELSQLDNYSEQINEIINSFKLK